MTVNSVKYSGEDISGAPNSQVVEARGSVSWEVRECEEHKMGEERSDDATSTALTVRRHLASLRAE